MIEVKEEAAGAGSVSRAAQPRLVGAFTLLGLALIVGGIGAVRKSNFFTEYRTFVVFFPKPPGLKPGAAVTFRQTPVGEVREIELVLTGKGLESEIKVIVDVRKGAMQGISTQAGLFERNDRELADALIAAGLRAGVRSSSPLAGSKSVDLDFHPELTPRFTGIPAPYPELPTAPTSMEILREKVDATLEKIADIPLDQMLLQVRDTLTSAQNLLENDDLEGTLRQAHLGLASANRVLTRAEGTMGGVDELMADVRKTTTSAEATMKSLDATLARLDATLATVDRNVERTADTQYEMVKNLDEMNELLRSLRRVTETLQRNPEALVQGKPESKEKP